MIDLIQLMFTSPVLAALLLIGWWEWRKRKPAIPVELEQPSIEGIGKQVLVLCDQCPIKKNGVSHVSALEK